MQCGLVENYPLTVNPSSHDYVGPSPAVPILSMKFSPKSVSK
jgi:hypothetical protein